MPTVLAVGFVLRLIGVNVGLPDSPDPREVLIAQDVLNLIHFTAPPADLQLARHSVVLYHRWRG